jgi:hypothetical protein
MNVKKLNPVIVFSGALCVTCARPAIKRPGYQAAPGEPGWMARRRRI